MLFRRQFKLGMHYHSNRNTKLFSSFTIWKRFFCLRHKSFGWLCRLKFCSRHPLTFAWKIKNGNRAERTPKLATCPFSDAGGAFAAEIQSNLQSFRVLGPASRLLASKQRLHGLQRATSGVDKKAPRKKARMPERCLSVLHLGYILSRRRVCRGKVSGRRKG